MNKKIKVKKLCDFIKERMTPEIMAFIFIIMIGSYILFLKPIIGVADNGDFSRIMSQNGLYHLSSNYEDTMFGYFNREYGIYKYANETTSTLFSTQSIFIKLAVFISKIFNNNNIFDIRFLSVIFLILHAIAGYLLVKVFTKDIKLQKFKYLIVGLYIFIFCDIAYIAYFNSFYPQAVMITCFLLSVGILLYMMKFNKINLVNLILLSIVSLLFLGSKQQLAPIGILIAILIIRMGIITKRKSIKIVSIGIGFSFILLSFLLFKSISNDLNYVNRFHTMTRGVLMNSEDPEKSLKEFGIDGSYSLLQGETFYAKVPSINPQDERLKEDFYENYSMLSIFIYYLKHPNEFKEALKVGINNAYTISSKGVGNYEKTEGKEYGEKSYFFRGWSLLKDNNFFKNGGFIIVYLTAYFIYSFSIYKRNFKNKNINGCLFEEVYLYIFLAGVSQIITSIILYGDADIEKHEFLYNLTFDLIIIKLVVQYLMNFEENNKGGKLIEN